MACLPSPQINVLKTSSVELSVTSKTVTVGCAIFNLASAPTTLTDAISGLGVFVGQPLPTDTHCLCQNISSRSLDGKSETGCSVIATYVGFNFYGSNTFGSGGSVEGIPLSYTYNESLSNELTNFNVKDQTEPLIVYYWPPSATPGLKASNTAQQGATIPVLRPYTSKTVRWYYNASGGFPDAVLTTYTSFVGNINSDTWDGGAPNTWLCTGVTASQVGLAQQLLIECTFMYRPQTFYEWAFYTDPKNGGSPIGAIKNVLNPDQNAAPTPVSNGALGILSYYSIDFADSFGFQ